MRDSSSSSRRSPGGAGCGCSSSGGAPASGSRRGDRLPVPCELDDPAQPVVRGRPAHPEGAREGVKVSLRLAFALDGGGAQPLWELAKRSFSLEVVDRLQLPIGGPYRPRQIRLLGVQEAVETVANLAPHPGSLEIQEGPVRARELQQRGHLLAALEVDNPSATPFRETAARAALAEVAAQGVSPTAAPENELDVGTGCTKGDRSSSKQNAPQ